MHEHHNHQMHKAQVIVDNFIKKVDRRNDPLEAYRKTDDYLSFQNKTEEIITKQVIYLKNHLSDITIWGDEDVPEHQIEAKVGAYLDKHMPTYEDEMSFETVHDNLKSAFIASIKAAYRRLGVKVLKKAADTVDYEVDFDLTNEDYIAALKDSANYLLTTKSKGYDETTKKRLINIVRDGRMNGDTIDDVASDLNAQVDSISSVRAFMIANTETASAFGSANQAFMYENNVPEKEWVTAGSNPCAEICQPNADDGPISVDSEFSSGDLTEPGHVNCECYVQGVGLDLTTMGDDELSSLILWDGA